MEIALRKLRKEKGYSVSDMASRFDVSDSTYRKWELGTNDMSITTACSLADFFGVTLDVLAGRSTTDLTSDEQYVVDAMRSTDNRGRETIVAVATTQAGDARQSPLGKEAIA